MRLSLLGTFSLSLLVTRSVFGWGLHYLVTDGALGSPGDRAFLESRAPVEPLELFLADQAPALARLFDEYYDWLAAKRSRRYLPVRFPASEPTVARFLAASRLYPGTRFSFVTRLTPGSPGTGGPRVPLATLSPFEKEERHIVADFEDVSGKVVPLRSVLTTFSDEPDWQIDHDLWRIAEYGYGAMPFGVPGDPTSGAAFHMQFDHDSWVVKWLAPQVVTTLTAERLELFARLSRTAFHTGHPYWGARFAAWASHYVEDMAQPYHAVAVPTAGVGFYLRYAFSRDRRRLEADTSQLATNRHYLYEDFVKLALQRSYPKREAPGARLLAALESGAKLPAGAERDTQALFDHVASTSAAEARRLDGIVVATYGPRATEDPAYDLAADPGYDNRAIFAAGAERLRPLIGEAERNLGLAGAAVRALLGLCRR